MTFQTWRKAVAALRDATGLPTASQLALARHRKVKFPSRMPRLLCAAVLRSHLVEELEETMRDVKPYQQDALEELRRSGDPAFSPEMPRRRMRGLHTLE
jgi:hypothetical protein